MDSIFGISFCDCICEHIYFKVFVVFVLSILITFCDEIDVLYERYMLYIFVVVFLLMLITKSDDYGTLILLTVLIVLISNNQFRMQ